MKSHRNYGVTHVGIDEYDEWRYRKERAEAHTLDNSIKGTPRTPSPHPGASPCP